MDISTIVVAIIVLVIYYCGTEQKRRNDKKLKEMQDNLKVADKIITFSGLSGKIVSVNEQNVIIATMPDNNKLSIEKWAIASIENKNEENNKEKDKDKNEKNKE